MITLMLVDDHEMLREGLRVMLTNEEDMSVVADTGDGRTAVSLAEKHKPSIVVMDITMPDLNGTEATAQIVSRVPGVKVVALSAYDTRQTVEMILKAGASGYVLKSDAYDDLAGAIRAVHSGHSFFSPCIAGIVLDSFVSSSIDSGSSPFLRLTPREREVLQLLSEGNSIKETSGRLFISPQTAHTHRLHLMEKLRVNSDAELTKCAIREGITSL